MPTRRHGRAASITGPVGLIVCVACAASAAGPTLVPPDEAAGLSAVACARSPLHEDCDAFPTFGACPAFALADEPPVPPLDGMGVEGVDGTQPWVFPVGLPHEETLCDGRDRPPLTPGPSPQGEGGRAPIEPGALFHDGLEPVVRAQSADIELLSLAGGAAPVEKTSLLSWATGTQGRIRGDYLTDFDETDRIGVQALTQSWLGFGLDAEVNYWQRPVAGLVREPLWTGDLNLIYNLVPHPRFKFRSGLGAAWTVDDGRPHAGYNITHGLDVYLLWRAMAIGEIDWGKLDDDDLFRYRLALGLTYDSFEFFSGYESYKLGGEKLDGWVNGVAWWY